MGRVVGAVSYSAATSVLRGCFERWPRVQHVGQSRFDERFCGYVQLGRHRQLVFGASCMLNLVLLFADVVIAVGSVGSECELLCSPSCILTVC